MRIKTMTSFNKVKRYESISKTPNLKSLTTEIIKITEL